MNSYGTRALEGASGVELTIALYDGIIRFMYNAIDAVDRGDAAQRRYAVKRAMNIVIHLQATLKMDIGGKPAAALAEAPTVAAGEGVAPPTVSVRAAVVSVTTISMGPV